MRNEGRLLGVRWPGTALVNGLSREFAVTKRCRATALQGGVLTFLYT